MDSNREWVEREAVDCQFKDERLGKRFRSLFAQLSSSPGDSIPLVCQDWASTKAAYQFFWTMNGSAKQKSSAGIFWRRVIASVQPMGLSW